MLKHPPFSVYHSKEILFLIRSKDTKFKNENELFTKGKENPVIPAEVDIPNDKIWLTRYYLFNQFDDGIQLDSESTDLTRLVFGNASKYR